MPKIDLYYDEVYAGPDCLIAWNNEEELSLTEWWDENLDDWAFAPAGDQDWAPTRYTPKAMEGETLTHWWDAIGELWHKVSHQYPLG